MTIAAKTVFKQSCTASLHIHNQPIKWLLIRPAKIYSSRGASPNFSSNNRT